MSTVEQVEIQGKYHPYDEYMDSGVEWLGVVPAHWNVHGGKRIFSQRREPALQNDVQLAASQAYGVVPQSLLMEMTGNKVMLALKGTVNFKHVSENDFVISLRSFEGGIEHSSYTGCASPAYTVLNTVKVVAPWYYRYLFKSTPYISALQASTDSLRDGKSITYDQFGAIPLPSPPLVEQSTIAAFLDYETAQIDRLIAKQQLLIELLKEKRQAVISHAVTKGLNPDAPMKNSGVEWLGEVPEHWVVTSIKHLVSHPIIDGPHVSPVKHDEGVPFLSAEALATGSINFDKKWGYISPKDHERYSKRYSPRRGDILMVKLGATTGTCAIVDTDKDFSIWVPLAVIRPKESVSSKFMLYLMKSDPVKNDINISWTYGTQQTLGLGTLANILVTMPPYDEQDKIARHIESTLPALENTITTSEEFKRLLIERRTALISAAVTGKIDLRGWTKPAEEVAA